MTGLLVVIAVAGASFGVGNLIRAVMIGNARFRTRWEENLFSTVLGIGVLSLLVFLLGLCGLLYARAFVCLLLVLNAAAAYALRNDIRLRAVLPEGLTRLEKAVLALIAVVACAHLALSFIPITNADALNHILPTIKHYLADHRISDQTHTLLYSTYPQLIGMLDMLVLSLSDEIAVNHLHALLGLLSCAVMYAVARNTAGRTAGLLTVLTMITSAVFLDMAASAKIDIGIALFTTAVFWTLARWHQEKKTVWVVLCAVFCAFSFGVKYNGGLLVIFPASALAYVLAVEKKAAGYARPAFLFCVVYAACISPWLAVNYAFAGNPLSPFMVNLFGDRAVSPELSRVISHHFDGLRRSALVYLKDVFLGMPVLFLSLLAIRKSSAVLRFSLLFAAAYFIAGNLLFPQVDRVFFPAFIVLFLAVGTSMADVLQSPGSRTRSFLLAAFAGIIGYSAFFVGHEIFREDNLPYFLGRVSRDEYLARRLPTYSLARRINGVVPQGERILSPGDTRGYYFDQQFIDRLSPLGYFILGNGSPESIVAAMEENSVRYVLFTEEPYYYRRQAAVFQEGRIFNDYFEPVADGENCRLYRLKPGSPRQQKSTAVRR